MSQSHAFKTSPIHFQLSACPSQPFVGLGLGQTTRSWFLRGLRAILDPVLVTDVSEVAQPSSLTNSKEDPGVPDREAQFPLSIECQIVRGLEDVLEEAHLGS